MNLNKNTPDYKLVERLQKGDIEAFNAVFEKYGSRLFGFALKYLKSKEEAEGLVQDVFLKVWANRKNLKKEHSLKSYLFTISYHDICKFFRRKELNDKLKEEIIKTREEAANPKDQIDNQSTLEQIEKVIEKLPSKQKVAFEKRCKEGKSTREIAKEMKLSPGTVDNYISAALKFIRKNISHNSLSLLLFIALFL